MPIKAEGFFAFFLARAEKICYYDITMDMIRTVEIKEDITSRNNAGAEMLKNSLLRRGVYYLNVMASPGSGKTTLIKELIKRLSCDYRVGVIEADIDGDVDAAALVGTGAKVIQMHTGGACHITYQMSAEALDALGLDGLDVVILENVGNLVCPAEFDTGASENLVLLSVPEGDDKPLKYPLMFEVASVIAVTKKDVAEAFDFDFGRAEKNVRLRNKNAPVFSISALSGDGVEELTSYLKGEIAAVIRK